MKLSNLVVGLSLLISSFAFAQAPSTPSPSPETEQVKLLEDATCYTNGKSVIIYGAATSKIVGRFEMYVSQDGGRSTMKSTTRELITTDFRNLKKRARRYSKKSPGW